MTLAKTGFANCSLAMVGTLVSACGRPAEGLMEISRHPIYDSCQGHDIRTDNKAEEQKVLKEN